MLEFLSFLMLLAMGGGAAALPLPAQAAQATRDAERKRRRAAETNNARDHAEAEKAEQKAVQVVKAATTPAPWPQVVPAGLPPFPSGWTPDNPPGPGVVTRAFQLLSELWRHGEGTFKVEQTSGRWIAYQARMTGAKKGVVAFRPSAPVAPPPAAPRPPSDNIARAPSSTPSTVPVSSSALALPTLRQGSSGPDVVVLQKRLGIASDGKFGPATAQAVRNFQAARGLKVDGVVGPQTWAALMGSA